MAKQTRRAVSLKAETYQQLRSWCEEHKQSMSGFVEERIAEFFAEQNARRLEQIRGGGVFQL